MERKTFAKYELTLVKDGRIPYQFDRIVNPSKIYDVAKQLKLNEKAEEEFYLICLDTKNNPIGIHLVSRGSLNSSIVHPREVFKRALINNACSIIVMHNHPSGDTTPSQEDIEMTKRLKECGKLLGVQLLDHIIIGDDNYLSMKEKRII